MKPTRLLSVTLAVLFLALPSMAQAQTAEDLARFEELVSEAQHHFEEGRYPRAIEVFKQAERIFAHPSLSQRILQASVAMGRCALAEERLESLQGATLPDAMTARLGEWAELVDGCESRGQVVVECIPATASLEVDGEPRECGEPFEMPTGSTQGRLRAEGYERTTVAIAVQEGETTEITVALDPLPPSAAERFVREGPAQPVGLVIAGTGVGLMVAGVWVDRDSADRQIRLERALRDDDEELVQELEAESRTRRRQSVGFFISGATLAGAGVGLFLLGRQFATPAGDLALHPRHDGFTVELRF